MYTNFGHIRSSELRIALVKHKLAQLLAQQVPVKTN